MGELYGVFAGINWGDENDPLIQKLLKAVPGAKIEERTGAPPDQTFVVVGKNPRVSKRRAKVSELSHGATRHEAVDRAVWLYGEHR